MRQHAHALLLLSFPALLLPHRRASCTASTCPCTSRHRRPRPRRRPGSDGLSPRTPAQPRRRRRRRGCSGGGRALCRRTVALPTLGCRRQRRAAHTAPMRRRRSWCVSASASTAPMAAAVVAQGGACAAPLPRAPPRCHVRRRRLLPTSSPLPLPPLAPPPRRGACALRAQGGTGSCRLPPWRAWRIWPRGLGLAAAVAMAAATGPALPPAGCPQR